MSYDEPICVGLPIFTWNDKMMKHMIKLLETKPIMYFKISESSLTVHHLCTTFRVQQLLALFANFWYLFLTGKAPQPTLDVMLTFELTHRLCVPEISLPVSELSIYCYHGLLLFSFCLIRASMGFY